MTETISECMTDFVVVIGKKRVNTPLVDLDHLTSSEVKQMILHQCSCFIEFIKPVREKR